MIGHAGRKPSFLMGETEILLEHLEGTAERGALTP